MTGAAYSDKGARTARFYVPGPPQGKDRPRARIVTPTGAKPFVSLYTPKETVQAEDEVRQLCEAAWFGEPSLRPMELLVTAYFEIPKGWPKWKREAAIRGEIAPTGKPDGDNIAKLVADAMNGVAYKDDGQIISWCAEKAWCPDGRREGVAVTIRENYRAHSGIARMADLVLLR